MPLNLVTLEPERTGGAVVGTQQFVFETDQPINEIFITMKFLEDTDLPTIAQVLTQFATNIEVSAGGSLKFSVSATDLWHFMNLARVGGLAAHQSDGTGADNAVMAITLPIPLAPIGVFHDINADYGLDPKNGKVVLTLTVPADAELTDRKYTVMYGSVPNKRPTKIMERITRKMTAAATGDGKYVDLPSGADIMLADLALFMTTALTAGTTTDAIGVNSISLEINQTEQAIVDAYALGLQTNLRNLSASATSPAESATYLYQNFNEPHKDDLSVQLPQKARLNLNMEVAEAMRFFGGISRKL